MSKLSIVPRLDRTEIRNAALKVLKEALARVESGETTAVVVIEQSAIDDVSVDQSGTMDVHKLIFGIEHIKHKLMKRLND